MRLMWWGVGLLVAAVGCQPIPAAPTPNIDATVQSRVALTQTSRPTTVAPPQAAGFAPGDQAYLQSTDPSGVVLADSYLSVAVLVRSTVARDATGIDNLIAQRSAYRLPSGGRVLVLLRREVDGVPVLQVRPIQGSTPTESTGWVLMDKVSATAQAGR